MTNKKSIFDSDRLTCKLCKKEFWYSFTFGDDECPYCATKMQPSKLENLLIGISELIDTIQLAVENNPGTVRLKEVNTALASGLQKMQEALKLSVKHTKLVSGNADE